jgi:hypothetical protein
MLGREGFITSGHQLHQPRPIGPALIDQRERLESAVEVEVSRLGNDAPAWSEASGRPHVMSFRIVCLLRCSNTTHLDD